jgi:hypothetical protein
VATVTTGGVDSAACRRHSPIRRASSRSAACTFDYDSYEVKAEYKDLVTAHAKFPTENRQFKMLIQGNTDERGSREYNLALGQKRADAIRKMLALLGAREEQLESVSLGEEKPKNEGHNEVPGPRTGAATCSTTASSSMSGLSMRRCSGLARGRALLLAVPGSARNPRMPDSSMTRRLAVRSGTLSIKTNERLDTVCQGTDRAGQSDSGAARRELASAWPGRDADL